MSLEADQYLHNMQILERAFYSSRAAYDIAGLALRTSLDEEVRAQAAQERIDFWAVMNTILDGYLENRDLLLAS